MPKSIAPAPLSLAATVASRGAKYPVSDPAAVGIASAVSMLSLTSTGTPRSGPAHVPRRPLLVQRGGDLVSVGVDLQHRAYGRAGVVVEGDAVEIERYEVARSHLPGRERLP